MTQLIGTPLFKHLEKNLGTYPAKGQNKVTWFQERKNAFPQENAEVKQLH